MNLDIEAIRYLRRKIETESAVFVQVLSSGGAKSYDEYRETAGVIRGLAISDSILSDLEQKLRANEDE